MKGILGRHAHAPGQLRGIDFTDDVGKLGPRSEPFRVTLLPWPPADRDVTFVVALQKLAGGLTERPQWILVEGRAGDLQEGNFVVQKFSQETHQATLALPFLAQEQHIVPGQQRETQFGNNRVVVADDARKKLLAIRQLANEVVVNLLLDGLRLPTGLPQLLQIPAVSPRRYCRSCADSSGDHLDSDDDRAASAKAKTCTPQVAAATSWGAKSHGGRPRYSSVTQPSDADLTFLMYLYSVPRVAFSGGATQRLRRAATSSSETSMSIRRC